MISPDTVSEANSVEGLWKRSIIVCGCGRSGTSILSSLVASYEGLEYSFDSPLIHWILGLCNGRRDEDLRKLLEIYLYREVFRGALSSRFINLNVHDLSSALKFKTPEELNRRKNSKLEGWLTSAKEEQYRMCIKVTDATFKIDELEKWLPGISFLGIVRNPVDVINSVFNKGWFARKPLSPMATYETLPFKAVSGVGAVPLWLQADDFNLWVDANDMERAAIYCLRATRALLNRSAMAHIINYDWFINSGGECALELEKRFSLRRTDHSVKIIESISPPVAKSKIFTPGSIRSSLLIEVEELIELIKDIRITSPEVV